MSRRSSIEVARERAELSRLRLSAVRDDVRRTALVKRREVINKYDVLETNRLRRPSTRETKEESGIYDMTRRLKGCNLGRDLERNYSPARGLLHQFRVNVVGSLGKIRVNVKGGDEAAEWFNGDWSKDCDFRSDTHWSDWLQNTIAGIIREGDQCSVFDDAVTQDDSGKLLTWESDQVVPLSADGFKAIEYPGKESDDVQDNGIIRDKYGREKAYITTGKRGVTVAESADDVTVYPRGVARLMSNPFRHNQGRGVPGLMTAAGNFLDIYEILGADLQTTKRAAQQYAYVKRTDAITDYDDPGSAPEYLPENMGKATAEVDAEGANISTQTGAKNYERLEAHTGGMTDYLQAGDDVLFPDANHPNSNMPAFIDCVHGMSGAALGVAAAYTRMRADSSYTAFRGDMIMTWVTYYWLQKRLERIAADWVGVKAITHAIRTGTVKKGLPTGWENRISWNWPRMPEVDQVDAENAVALGLKNGTMDFSQLLGPDWERRLEDYAAQISRIRELGLPLGILEAKSGGMSNPKKDGAVAPATSE